MQFYKDTPSNAEIWEQIHRSNKADVVYPYDKIISFVLKNFNRTQSEHFNFLDFGCGVGNHLKFLVENHFQAYGVDISRSAVTKSKALISQLVPSYPVEDRILENKGTLPFKDNFFDCVLDRSALGQLMSDDIDIMIGEIDRVLKPGGKYYGINFSDRNSEIWNSDYAGGGDFLNFQSKKFKGRGSRHFFSPSDVVKRFRSFELLDVRVTIDRSLIHEDFFEEIIVIAQKN